MELIFCLALQSKLEKTPTPLDSGNFLQLILNISRARRTPGTGRATGNQHNLQHPGRAGEGDGKGREGPEKDRRRGEGEGKREAGILECGKEGKKNKTVKESEGTRRQKEARRGLKEINKLRA